MKKGFSLYDVDRNRIKLSVYKEVGRGSFGIVYLMDEDRCFKRFFDDECSCKRLNPDVLKAIAGMRLDNYYRIYQILYSKGGTFKGYTMEYYKGIQTNILTMPVAYTLNNLISLLKAVTILADHQILVSDLHEENIIFLDSKIMVIDADLYSFNKDADKDLFISNMQSVYSLFRRLYFNASKRMKTLDYEEQLNDYQFYANLFPEDCNYNNVEKKLIKYKYPIDYIRKYK